MKIVRGVAIAAACCAVTGCLYYDSQWGQATAEQKRAAARLTAASVEGRRGSGEEIRRTATVRACATRAYAAETLSWQDRFDELLRTANSVLEPSVGLTLKNAGTSSWTPPQGEGSLVTLIADLPACEGAEADWVVGLVESNPKVVSDFHVLGRGEIYSPYLAMRASNDPAEIEALTHALPDLDAAARDKLYSDRKRHKTLTLFLHELAHTLGAIHRTSRTTIMHPAYDASEKGYDEATLTLMRNGLSIRLDRANGYADARKFIERAKEGFVESERLSEVAYLGAMERSRTRTPPRDPVVPSDVAAPTAHPVVALQGQILGFETLSKDERQSFDAALKVEGRSPREAWELASALFEAHPAVREVQDLRCRLAKERKFYAGIIEAHCARSVALQGTKPEETTAAP
jgi:hypothetical protein